VITLQLIPADRLPLVYLVYLVPAMLEGYQLAVYVGEAGIN
jgi:hypothetical protein